MVCNDVEEILSDYHLRMQTNSMNSSEYCISSKTKMEEIREETVNRLKLAGYEAYCVTSETYDEVQEKLATDLGELGINPNYSCIIVIEGNEAKTNGIMPMSTPSSTFRYAYNGTTYTLRYLTVTADDNPVYGKASTVDILKTDSQKLIENCLNTAISAYISSIHNALGTVASICGLGISSFGTTQTSTLYMNAGTNWTRTYTQVWNTGRNTWSNGASVESVNAFVYMSGQYYDASLNRYVAVPTQQKAAKGLSAQYSNKEWRNRQGVIGYLNSSINYDVVGDVIYKYGGTTKITHKRTI